MEEIQKKIDTSASKAIRYGNYSGSADAKTIQGELKNLVTDTSMITGVGPWQITGSKTGTKYLIKQSYEVIPMPENTGTRTEMNVQVGDFVNYDAGNWTQEEIDKLGNLYSGENIPNADNPYTFGGFKAGQSRNICITPYRQYQNIYSGGWRILSINNDNSINIIHAGTSEGYFHPSETNAAYKSIYILDKNHTSNSIQALKRDWNMYENLEYTISNSAHLVKNDELNNNILITGSYYWEANYNNHRDFYFIDFSGRYYRNGYRYCFGIRPVVTLKAECLFQNINDENTTTHNTQDTAWNLVI